MNSNFGSIAFLVLIIVQIISASVVQPSNQVDYPAYIQGMEQSPRPFRFWKRAHNIDTRALNQFKNCYFSPIQCVLMERK